MEDNLSKCILVFGINYLQEINNSMNKKKNILIQSLLSSSKVRIVNFMLVISLYDDLDFKCHLKHISQSMLP